MPKPIRDTRFYSWEQFVTATGEPPSDAWCTGAGARRSSELNNREHTWDLDVDYDAARAMLIARDPWPEGRALIEQDAREQATRTIRRHGGQEYTWSTHGDMFDVAAVLEGRPEAWLELQDDPCGSEPSVVHLIVSVSAAYNIDARLLAERMRAVAACVLTLEAAGIPVLLWTINVVRTRSALSRRSKRSPELVENRLATIVQIKSAGQPLNVARVVITAHPAYFRRLGFRLIEQTPSVTLAGELARTYGIPMNPTPEEIHTWFGRGEYIYCPAMSWEGAAAKTAATLGNVLKARLGYTEDQDDDGP